MCNKNEGRGKFLYSKQRWWLYIYLGNVGFLSKWYTVVRKNTIIKKIVSKSNTLENQNLSSWNSLRNILTGLMSKHNKPYLRKLF